MPMTVEEYAVTIKISSSENLEFLESGPSSIWVSYQFMGILVQTDQFIATATFPSSLDHFLWYREDSGQIDIHICSEEHIVGSTQVQIESLFFYESAGQPDQKPLTRYQEIIATIIPENHKGGLCDQVPQLHLSIELRPCRVENSLLSPEIKDDNCILDVEPAFSKDSTANVNTSDEQICEAVKQINIAREELEKKQRDWIAFQKGEESKFRKHLQAKEDKVRTYLQQQVELNQEEHSKTMALCRSEYKILESRLKKALCEVEAKEREMKRKMNEVEMREQVLQNEAQHMIDMEGNKLKMTLGKIKILEKESNITIEKCKNLENALSEERQKYEQSDVCKSQHEASTLKNRVVELESVLKREVAEKNGLASEQERYRNAAHKLANLLRQERSQQRLSINNNEESDIKHLSRISKLQRIKSELSTLVVDDNTSA